MFSKTDNSFNRKSSAKTARHMPVFLVLLLVILPLLIAAVYTSRELFRDLDKFTFSGRETTAFLVATTLKEKLDRVIDVGVSLSTRVQFQKLVEAGKWDEAIKIMERVPHDFTYIDRVSLFDPQGILKAATQPTPEILSVIGKDFSYRDYYLGVSKNWEPYVAEAIKPAVPLGYNLVPVAIPIKSEAHKVLGIMLLNIKLDTIAEWSKSIDVGPAGFVYIVDHKGNLVAHPTLLPAEDIIDFSLVPSVQKVLRGERGVEVIFNEIENEERVTAYEPVPHYGWGAIVIQPTRTAFVERNKAVGRMAAIWAFVILAVGIFTFRLLRDRTVMKTQRDREKLLLESIGDGVFAIDRFFNIVSWNKSAETLTGWSREEALGKPMREVVKFVRESDKKENIVFIEEAMLYAEPKVMELSTLLIRKDGTEILVGDSAAPLLDEHGKVSGAIVIFRDKSQEVAAQKISEEILFRTIHDLRAPATAIKLAAEMSRDAEVFSHNPENLKESIDLIQEANTRMLALINDLLKSIREQQAIAPPISEAVDVAAIIQSIGREAQVLAERKKVQITYNIPSDLPKVLGRAREIQEIFSNLVDNAVKYNKEGGSVTISALRQDSLVVVEVTDTGFGIPKDKQDKIFQKFYRAPSSQAPETEGTGLGLFLTRRLVEQMGGDIMFSSIEGQGTTIAVSLPIVRTDYALEKSSKKPYTS